MISLPRGVPVRKKVNPARINLPEAMEKLRVGTFTGYLRFDAPQGTGVLLFQCGQLISAIFVEQQKSDPLIAYDAIAKIFELSILGSAVLNIYRLSEDLVLGIHALLHGCYLEQGVDLAQFDVRGQIDKIVQESLTVCLRVYANDQVALIFYDHGYPLGFFHEGHAELDQSADISVSVARFADAKLDVLEVHSVDEIVLADLMGSADLGPIWQKARKLLLQDRQKHEEKSLRQQGEDQEQKRQEILTTFKDIAGNHIGQFGVVQVEKAFSGIGPNLTSETLEEFYAELKRLARLIVGQSTIHNMIEEMKKGNPLGDS